MRWDDLKTEACSVARTVSVIGDRWTILILRDCFLRVRRFEDFERRRHPAFWRELRASFSAWDRLIGQFNAEVGVAGKHARSASRTQSP